MTKLNFRLYLAHGKGIWLTGLWPCSSCIPICPSFTWCLDPLLKSSWNHRLNSKVIPKWALQAQWIGYIIDVQKNTFYDRHPKYVVLISGRTLKNLLTVNADSSNLMSPDCYVIMGTLTFLHCWLREKSLFS